MPMPTHFATRGPQLVYVTADDHATTYYLDQMPDATWDQMSSRDYRMLRVLIEELQDAMRARHDRGVARRNQEETSA